MLCTNFANIKKELAKLTFRQFESRDHESHWGDYEKIMMVRSFMMATSRTLLWLITAFLVQERYDRYELFVEKNGGPANNEAAQANLPYAKAILYVLYAIRFFINIFSLKWPKLIKGSFYVEMIVSMTESFIPDDFTLEQEQMFQISTGYVFFWLGYFRFWIDLTWLVVSFVPMYANRVILHGDTIERVILNAALIIPWHIFNAFIIHWVITKIGFLFIDAEVLRKGNE